MEWVHLNGPTVNNMSGNTLRMKELETDPGLLGQTVLATKVLSSKGKGMGMGFSPPRRHRLWLNDQQHGEGLFDFVDGRRIQGMEKRKDNDHSPCFQQKPKNPISHR